MKRPAAVFAACLASSLLPVVVLAQIPGVQGVAEREIRRQEAMVRFAGESIAKGDEALATNDYESAFSFFKSAVDALPSGGEATAAERRQALDGLARASMSLARQRISEGRFEDAGTVLALVLEDSYLPNFRPALDLQAKLAQPGRFNPALTPQFIANVEEVKQLLTEAEGFYQSGRFDLAFKRYEQVLNIDPYNIAARRGMEGVNRQRSQYASTAYNEARADMLNEVNQAWEMPVRRFDTQASSIIEQPQIDVRGTASVNRKLDEIIIPSINFTDASIREALEFIRQRAAALDTAESDPANRGVNLVLKLAPGAPEENVLINLNLSDVPLRAAIDYVARAANMKLKVEPFAVVVVPESEPTDVLITKEYKVAPGFIQNMPDVGGGAFAPPGGGVSTTAPGSMSSVAERSGARQFLESQGVTFPDGSSATFLAASSKLIVKNTQGNLDIIDALVETTGTAPPTQVEIESKFLEVTQNNLQELGIDWLVGQFNMPFGSGVYGGGGTEFGGNAINANAFPLLTPGGVPIGAASATSGAVTGGNRSGTSAISVNAVDALLFATPVGPAPAVLALAGVFTNPQFQVVLRALSQQKGVDLVSAPKVTTKSGQRATIEIIREFRYPSEYDLPQTTSVAGQVLTPVVPTTPTSFETKNVGITLEVEPTVGPDNFSIDLILAPRVVEFEGFINYGSQIFTIASTVPDSIAIPPIPFISQRVLLSDNIINRPVFSTREVTTEVTVYDGQTVVLGGLLREDVQQVQDKVPILGDIPLAGRLFRTKADQHIKRNLIMFVTASLLDPAGQPIIQIDEEGEDIPAPDISGIEQEAVFADPLTIPMPQ
jgi:general secretion pathway protein D